MLAATLLSLNDRSFRYVILSLEVHVLTFCSKGDLLYPIGSFDQFGADLKCRRIRAAVSCCLLQVKCRGHMSVQLLWPTVVLPASS